MKYLLALFTITILQFGCVPVGNKAIEPITAADVTYTKSDLLKIKWIEGKWKGLDDDKPFYEIYTFVNDSTIKTISYEWDGKDSSKSFVDYLYWKDGLFYLGEKRDWAAKTVSDSMVVMVPNSSRIHNDITWKLRDDKGWDAVLVAPKGTQTYRMERFDPFVK